MTTKEFKDEMLELSYDRLNDPNTPRDIKIISEGDSWFDYPPQKDIIDFLIKKGYAIDKKTNLAQHGDTLENMVYGSEYQIHKKNRTVSNPGPISLNETLSSIRKYNPKFILFSAGGNDIVGEELINYINHIGSEMDLIRTDVFINHVNGPIKKAISHFIKTVSKSGDEIQILMDGYDYAIPNGTLISYLGITFSGPWILPSMGKKGITNPITQKEIIKFLVDTFNNMLSDLSQEFRNFHFVDLRGMFPNENDWHNEIHLRKSGYEKIANKYHDKIIDILGYNPFHEI